MTYIFNDKAEVVTEGDRVVCSYLQADISCGMTDHQKNDMLDNWLWKDNAPETPLTKILDRR